MTHKEQFEHLLSVLQDNKRHTIVRHINAAGKPCYRVRDELVNPLANMPDSIFDDFTKKNLIIKLNDREWQLKSLNFFWMQ